MNAGMELMGMKECRECGDPYTPAEPDTGVCSCCIMSHEVAALRARVADLERERDEARALNHRGLMKLIENERLRDALEEIAGMCSENAEQMQAIAQDALGSMPPSNLPYICPKSVAVAEDLTPGALNTTPETTPADAVLGDALLRHERARIADLERERDAAFRDAHRAEADAARLREALEALVEYERKRHPPKMGGDEFPPSLREVMDAARAVLASAPSVEPEGPDYSGLCSAPECGGHCGYVHARGCEAIREYLAEHGGDPYKAPPRAEPTPRDMRVAEAVRARIARHIRISPRFEGQLTTPNDNGLLGRVAQEVENLNLAAVVAKAVKP